MDNVDQAWIARLQPVEAWKIMANRISVKYKFPSTLLHEAL